jgi:flagellar hook-associated protein 2
MTAPISSVGGLASGIQWKDLVDQVMALEKQRSVDPVTADLTATQKAADAWQQFQDIAAKFRDASNTVRDSLAFDLFSATVDLSASSGHSLLTATAATGAVPGTYGVEVVALARAEKLGGNVATNASTALGIAGQFSLNGKTVTVGAGDTLATLRDKINAANTGTSPSGVSASILAGGGGSRLVLTSDATGSAGIEAVDDGSGTLQALGFTDGTTTANITASGATQTNRLSSATASIASLLGVPLPAPSVMKVGGQTIYVDFAVDSLSSIAAKINAALGSPNAATVTPETVGGNTMYRLVTDAAVQVDTGGILADSMRTLSVLGFTKGGHGGIAQVVKSANTFGDALGGNATNATLLTDLQAGGQSLGIAAGDTINIGGTRGDGTTVARTFSVAANSTLQDLLAAINDSGSGFGLGPRSATASVNGGRVALTDAATGDSQLGLSLTVSHAGSPDISLGSFSTAGGTSGRTLQISSGGDARIRVDGQLLTRSSNSISDAITGVSLNLQSAEPGTTVNIDVTRDTAGIAAKLQAFAAAYNTLQSFVKTNTATNGALAHDPTLRSMGSSLTSVLLTGVRGLNGTYTSAAMAGLHHDATGVLSLDTDTLTAALQTNFDAVKHLFSLAGSATDSEVSFISAGIAAQPSTTPYAVQITQAATLASVTGASWTTYATSGAPDTMTFNDAATGASGSITLANGDTIDAALQKMNTLFASLKMHLTATKTIDNRLQVTSTDYGTSGGFTVGYTPGAGGDGTATLGIAAQAYAGLNVAGTINGVAGTGSGQFLTGASGDPSAGIVIKYTGATARAAGSISLTLGVGGEISKIATSYADGGPSSAAAQQTSNTERATTLQSRIDDLTQRLDARRAALTAQFVAMESALAKSQALSSALTSQINSLSLQSSSK